MSRRPVREVENTLLILRALADQARDQGLTHAEATLNEVCALLEAARPAARSVTPALTAADIGAGARRLH